MESNEDINVTVNQINSSKVTGKFEIDKRFAAAIMNRLEPYKNLPRTFKPALEEIADYVRDDMIPRTFEREGPNWRPLARRTVAERIAQGYGGRHPILQRTGDLYRELTDKAHPKHVEVIRVGKNARIEVGGSSKKFRENQLGNRATNLPARPMIPGTGDAPLPYKDRVAMRNILLKAMKTK